MMAKKMKRLFALVLALSMTMSLLSVTAFAEGEEPCAHEFSEWEETAATCTEAGSKTRTCALCGETESEEIPALGHSGEWIVKQEATCGAAGSQSRTCALCGAEETEEIPATGQHTFGAWTDTEDGGESRVCEICGTVETKESNAPNGDEDEAVTKLIAEIEALHAKEYWNHAVNDNDRDRVKNAKKAYAALTEEQKAQISDEMVEKLLGAENAVVVGAILHNLPALETILEDPTSKSTLIWNYWNAYNTLPEEQKAAIQKDYPEAFEKITAAVAVLEEATGYGYVTVGTEKYQTVREALAWASDGDTLFVYGRVNWGGNATDGWPAGGVTIRTAPDSSYERNAVVLNGAGTHNDPYEKLTRLGCGITIRDVRLEVDNSMHFIVAGGHRLEICDDVEIASSGYESSGSNGHHFMVIGGSDTKSVERTELILSSGRYALVIGGGIGQDVTGNTSVTIGGTAEIEDRVYGGGFQGNVQGDVYVAVGADVKSSVVTNYYGGGFSGNVEGNAAIKVDAKLTKDVYNSVYGGCQRGAVGGSTDVTIGARGEAYCVYGGCDDDNYMVLGRYENSPTGNQYNRAFEYFTISDTMVSQEDTYVSGSTQVTVNGMVNKEVYGGGDSNIVKGDTHVTINGQVGGEVDGGEVFGGGNVAAVEGSTYVTIGAEGRVNRVFADSGSRGYPGLWGGTVNGGSYNAKVFGDSHIVLNGKVGSPDLGGLVFGSAYNGSSSATGVVAGTSYITVNAAPYACTGDYIWRTWKSYPVWNSMSGVFGAGFNYQTVREEKNNTKIIINTDMGAVPVYAGGLLANIAGGAEVIVAEGGKVEALYARGENSTIENGRIGGAVTVRIQKGGQVGTVYGYGYNTFNPDYTGGDEGDGSRNVTGNVSVVFDGNTSSAKQIVNADLVKVTNSSDVTIDNESKDNEQLVNVANLTIDENAKLHLLASAHILGSYTGGYDATKGTLVINAGKKLAADGKVTGMTNISIVDANGVVPAASQVYVISGAGSTTQDGNFVWTDARNSVGMEWKNNGDKTSQWWLVQDNGGGGTTPPSTPTPTPDSGTEIPDPDVPTGELPDTPVEPEQPVDIDDPEVPLGEAPKTGDLLGLWLALAGMSGIGLAGIHFTSRKKEREN